MVLIGIDPHKATHTAVAVDTEEIALGELTVQADRHQVERLLKWAIDFPERRWAIESANGLGFLLAQQLVAAGEDVVDVPPTLAARVRVLGSGKTQKNDPNDALSTAIAAMRAKRLRSVVAENHGGVLRLLADHHHDLGSLRTQAVCRLHALVRCFIPGGTGLRLSAARAAVVVRSVRPTNAVDAERKRMALGFVADIRRLDAEIAASKARIVAAVAASMAWARWWPPFSSDTAATWPASPTGTTTPRITPRLPSKPRAVRECDTDSTPGATDASTTPST